MQWIALFRGINVGGNNMVPMRALAEVLSEAGFSSVKTYIQSGNVIFRCAGERGELLGRVVQSVQQKFGFPPAVILVSPDEIDAIIRDNPFPHAEAEPKTLHLFFLTGTPKPEAPDNLARLAAASETAILRGSVLYLHAPDGIGRSKLVGAVDKALGVATTARNWRTITTLRDMLTQD